MTLKYLITGATGGLGSHVLSHLVANVPASEYAAASSSEANRKKFEDRGIAFRVVNYDDPQSLVSAFHDVENLLFVSTNTFDVEKRRKQHQNFVDAAKAANVGHVCLPLLPQKRSRIPGTLQPNLFKKIWYTSLAFGGFRSDSQADVQQAHLMTEEMMRK